MHKTLQGHLTNTKQSRVNSDAASCEYRTWLICQLNTITPHTSERRSIHSRSLRRQVLPGKVFRRSALQATVKWSLL